MAVLVAGSACDGEGSKESQAKVEGESTASEAEPQDKPADELIAEQPAALPPPLADLTWFAPRAAAEKAIASVTVEEDRPGKHERLDGYGPSVQVKPLIDGQDRLTGIELKLPRESLDTIRKRWGEGTEIRGKFRNSIGWSNEKLGTQARVELPRREGGDIGVTYFSYQPLKDTLGKLDPLGFEKEPLLGMTPEQVKEAYATLHPYEKDGVHYLVLPAYELTHQYAQGATRVALELGDEGTVHSITVGVDFRAFDPVRETFFAILQEAELPNLPPEYSGGRTVEGLIGDRYAKAMLQGSFASVRLQPKGSAPEHLTE
jgi:hypothetical protein